MENSTIFNALLSYEYHIGAYDIKILHSDLTAINKCKDYLNNGGKETKEWLFENGIVIYRALNRYHADLDSNIREARNSDDTLEVSSLRNERLKVIKYKILLKDFDKFLI